MIKIRLSRHGIQRVRAGNKLIRQEDIDRHAMTAGIKTGQVIQLVDQAHQFVAKALYVNQKKGLAWVFTQDPAIDWGAPLIDQQLKEALTRRTPLMMDPETNSFRLFNGEGDGIGGVTIDWYAGYVQFNWYSQALYAWRDAFVHSLEAHLEGILGIYETKRYPVADGDWRIRHTAGQLAPEPLVIRENGVAYAVYLGQDWMTGIFLDQREVRAFLSAQAQDRTVLNLFSYTGAFSVAAAVGGATHTVSVDVANRSVDWTEENFRLNGIEPDRSRHEIRVMDVFDYIQYAQRHDLQFDLIVCDPPSFARTKRTTFSAEQNYRALAEDLFRLTRPGGMLILSTNHSGYPMERFREEMIQVANQVSPHSYLINQLTMPAVDFPTTRDPQSQYLKVLVFYHG